MEITPDQAQKIWYEASEKVKDKVIAPTLYTALEAAVGITLDGDFFVVGFSSADSPLAGHIRSAQHQGLVLQCLKEVLNKEVRLLTIDGTTYQDYENYKKRKAASDAVTFTISEKRARDRAAEKAWEEISEKITRGYARLQLRQLAQTRGRFIKDAFIFINKAIIKFGYSDESEDVQKRALARVFEKLATVVDVPSALLAYEFFKLKDEGKLD